MKTKGKSLFNLTKILVPLSLTAMLFGCSPTGTSTTKAAAQGNTNGQLTVKYIDVDQGDSTLIISPEGKTVLIDAGDNQHGKKVISELKKSGVRKIDYFILTHPDADHVGGADDIINNSSIPVKRVVMPKKSHTTKTFEQALFC